jgi:phosphoglycolate phosphatase-like HAD superfamily hydrolase
MKQLAKPASTRNTQKYPPNRSVAVDVDGTLHRNGIPCEAAIKSCRDLKARGFELFLWSARGAEHATRVAKDLGIDDLFSHFLTKPGYIVDDEGWSWIRFTRRLRPGRGRLTAAKRPSRTER